MKIEGVSGEFAFRALVRYIDSTWKPDWIITPYYFNRNEVEERYPGYEIKWPIEVYEDGSIYIPSEGELNDDK